MYFAEDMAQSLLSAFWPQILNPKLCNRFGFVGNKLSNFTSVVVWLLQ